MLIAKLTYYTINAISEVKKLLLDMQTARRKYLRTREKIGFR